jgi:hypothetical protein
MKELDFYSDKMKEAQKLTGLISDYLNNFQYKENSAYFNEAMSREHRTLQENFARLIFAYIEYMASDEYRTDGRNDQSKRFAELMLNGFEQETTKLFGEGTDNRKPSKWLGTI